MTSSSPVRKRRVGSSHIIDCNVLVIITNMPPLESSRRVGSSHIIYCNISVITTNTPPLESSRRVGFSRAPARPYHRPGRPGDLQKIVFGGSSKLKCSVWCRGEMASNNNGGYAQEIGGACVRACRPCRVPVPSSKGAAVADRWGNSGVGCL